MKILSSKIFAEAFLLYSLPLFFIISYVLAYGNPSAAMFEHLYVVSILIIFTVLLRILIDRFTDDRTRGVIIAANLYAVVFSLFISYYAIILAGLHRKGSVLPAQAIASYTQQSGRYLEALGLSYVLVIAFLALSYVLIVAFFYFFLKTLDWTSLQWPVRTGLLATLIVLILLILCEKTVSYFHMPDHDCKEPLHLTFHPGAKST